MHRLENEWINEFYKRRKEKMMCEKMSVHEWIENEWMKEWMDGWMLSEWTNEWIDGRRGMSNWIDKWMKD